MLQQDKRTKLFVVLGDIRSFWTLWRERNHHIFEEREGSFANIIESIYWVALWASLHKDLNQFSFSD